MKNDRRKGELKITDTALRSRDIPAHSSVAFALGALLFVLGFFDPCFVVHDPSSLAEAQQPAKAFRIGFLDNTSASGNEPLVEAFRQEMRKLGWIEGKNFTLEKRFADGKFDRLPDLAAELVRLK